MEEKSRLGKRLIASFCVLTLLGAGLTGCKSAGAKSGSDSNSQHVEFKIILPQYGEDSGITQGQVYQQISKLTNATIDIQWTPSAAYNDKFNVLMSSNQLPDVLLVPNMKTTNFVDAVNANQFWQLDSYIGQYANFKNIKANALANAKTNGKLYVLPRERLAKRQMVLYRADWAKKAGLGAPDTLDKIQNMAKTFADGDFDGDGKKDTIGLMLGTSSDGGGTQIDFLNTLVVANGGFNSWGLSSGKVTSMYNTSQFLDTLTFLRNMYAQGLISSDFSITKTTQVLSDYVDKEKTGLWLNTSLPTSSDPLLQAKQKADPNVTLGDIYGYTFLKDAKGNPSIPSESGLNGGLAFPKATVKNTARLKQILGAFNQLNSKEGQRLLYDGIEGREYQVLSEADGTQKLINSTLFNSEVADLNQMQISMNYVLTTANDNTTAQLVKDRNTYKDSDLVADISLPLNSDTYSKDILNLDKIMDDGIFKYIMGNISGDAYKQVVSSWDKSGGDQIASEFTQDYNKSHKK